MAKSRKETISSVSSRFVAVKGEREEKKSKVQGDVFRGPRFCREIRRSGPGTPAPCWKLYENRSYDVLGRSHRRKWSSSNKKAKDCNGDDNDVNARFVVSARKLAAAVWALQRPEDSSRCGGPRSGSNGASVLSSIHRLQNSCSQSLEAYAESSYLYKLALMRSNNYGALRIEKNGCIPHSTAVPNNKSFLRGDPVKETAAITNPELEKATKWDFEARKTSDYVFRAFHQINTLEEQQTTSVSLVRALKTELAQARLRVHELEHAHKSTQNEVQRFLKKMSEEKAIRQKKEHERISVMIQKLKEDFNNESKAKRRMEAVNGKLAKELAEAKLTIIRSVEDLEKERKARQLMEDVCDELAREIGEDKAEVEQLKHESIKVREEVEEERRMLQMAEVWREERVQMKLVDAKLALEEKSSALDKLREDLESFINSRVSFQGNGTAYVSAADVQDAELLREAACSLQIQDLKEFSYQPPTSDDVFSAFGDLQSNKANNETSDARTGWDPEDGCYSSRSHTSKILTVTPETHGFNRNLIRSRLDMKVREGDGQTHLLEDEVKRREEDGEEDETEWDYASSEDEEGSSNFSQESKTSLNGRDVDGSFSGSVTDWEENKDSAIVITEIEAYSPTAEQLRTKDSSSRQLWGPNSVNGDCYKTISTENNFPANTMTSPGQRSLNGICSPSNLGPWSSPDAGNPHIARGIKGCVEWPRGIQKNSLKARLLEAKMESQKSQLRHVLKQKH